MRTPLGPLLHAVWLPWAWMARQPAAPGVVDRPETQRAWQRSCVRAWLDAHAPSAVAARARTAMRGPRRTPEPFSFAHGPDGSWVAWAAWADGPDASAPHPIAVGIDAERISPFAAMDTQERARLASHFLDATQDDAPAAEQAQRGAAAPSSAAMALAWTRREARLKALGEGMAEASPALAGRLRAVETLRLGWPAADEAQPLSAQPWSVAEGHASGGVAVLAWCPAWHRPQPPNP